MSGGSIFDWSNETGFLTVEGLDLLCPAFGIFEDLTPLAAPGDWRGIESTVIPFQAGRLPTPAIVDEQTIKLKMPVAGDMDPDGNRYEAGPVAGYMANLAILLAVLDQPDPLVELDGCRQVYWTIPEAGLVFGARCKLYLDTTAPLKIGTDMIYGNRGALKRCVLTVQMPDGLFSPVGS